MGLISGSNQNNSLGHGFYDNVFANKIEFSSIFINRKSEIYKIAIVLRSSALKFSLSDVSEKLNFDCEYRNAFIRGECMVPFIKSQVNELYQSMIDYEKPAWQMTPPNKIKMFPVPGGFDMKKLLQFGILLLIGCNTLLPLDAQSSIYNNGWTEFNKNGKKDVFEVPHQTINAGIADLLFQMILNDKTSPMATLYGYPVVLKVSFPFQLAVHRKTAGLKRNSS